MLRLIKISAGILALGISVAVHAATIISSSSTPPSTKLGANGQATVQHVFGIKYFNNEKFGCGAQLTYSDGTPPEKIEIKAPTTSISRSKVYKSTGNFSATLYGVAFNGLVACLGSQTTSVAVQGDTITAAKGFAFNPGVAGDKLGPAKQEAGKSSSGGFTGMGMKMIPAKLASLTLAQTTIQASNTNTLQWSLKSDRAVNQCQLDYEVRTMYTGADAINVSLIGPYELGRTKPEDWALPVSNSTLNLGTLLNNQKQFMTGKFRLFVRAKNVPNNTCSGETHVDFEITNKSPLNMQALTQINSNAPKITGVYLAPNWYDFKKKQVEVMVKGSGDPNAKCGYQIDFHNDTLNKNFPAIVQAQGTIAPSMDWPYLTNELPAGTYTATAKPWFGPDSQVPACQGKASTTGKIVVPKNTMTITNASLFVVQSMTDNSVKFSQINKKSVTVTPDQVKTNKVMFQLQFANPVQAYGMGCTFVQWVHAPYGDSKQVMNIDGPNANTTQKYYSNGMGAYSEPGVYKVHYDGKVQAAGQDPSKLPDAYPPCEGQADVTVVVEQPLSNIKLNAPLNVTPGGK